MRYLLISAIFIWISSSTIFGQLQLLNIDQEINENTEYNFSFTYNDYGVDRVHASHNDEESKLFITYNNAGGFNQIEASSEFKPSDNFVLTFIYDGSRIDTVYKTNNSSLQFYEFIYEEDLLQKINLYNGFESNDFVYFRKSFFYNSDNSIKKLDHREFYSASDEDYDADIHNYTYEDGLVVQIDRTEYGGHGYSKCYFDYTSDSLISIQSDYFSGGDYEVASSLHSCFYTDIQEDVKEPFELIHLIHQLDLFSFFNSLGHHARFYPYGYPLNFETEDKLYGSFFLTADYNYGIPTNVIDNQSMSLTIYPNPATNVISIQNPMDFEAYTIYNTFGQIVASGQSSKNIDISKITKGYYVIQCSNKNETVSSPFIKH